MRSVEGEVKDIQSTIEILNKKVNEVGKIPFLKQVNFDESPSSTPEFLLVTKSSGKNPNERVPISTVTTLSSMEKIKKR
jgi:hypothetical protein